MPKFGYRKPSIKKSFSAKTTGSATRKIKASINPTYGKKGSGLINDPKKTSYNKVYNKTTKSTGCLFYFLLIGGITTVIKLFL